MLEEVLQKIKQLERELILYKEIKEKLLLLETPITDNSMIEIAVEILKKDSPLSTKDLSQKILEKGFKTKNVKGFRNCTFSMLDRNPQIFRKTGKGIWELNTNENQNALHE